MGRGEGDVDVAALLYRLTAVHRLEHGELARSLLDDPGDAKQVLSAVGARKRGPRLERLASVADGGVDVLGTRRRHRGEDLLGGGVDRLEVIAGDRVREAAPDVEAIGVPKGDNIGRLGGRRILPGTTH
jgi:hypothetical protein